MDSERNAMAVFSEKVVWITGAGSGIGRAVARMFAAEGASLVLIGRRADKLKSVHDEVCASGGRGEVLVLDVCRRDQVETAAAGLLARHQRVDVLVNNAGMSLLYPSLNQVSEAVYDKVLATNLKGPFRLTALVGTKMAASDGGSVINISSVAATSPGANALPYGAAKAGLEALTVGFMRAFGPKVRVNTIRCGAFRTDISKAWGDISRIDEMARLQMPLGRIGEPEDIVGAALFLASDAAAYCTGTTIRLDGGGSR
jgi:NAD(P)-dependent dehydrogenase (short-subunit alcohol dehydrogenase family)